MPDLLRPADYRMAGEVWGVDPAVIEGVAQVESAGSGFLPDGRPKILFEGHIFWRQLKAKGLSPLTIVAAHPEWRDILHPRWTKEFYSGNVTGWESVDDVPGYDEWDRLRRATWIDPAPDDASAFESASWGKFQILGMHWRRLGYSSVGEFVQLMYYSEAKHLDAFMRFVETEGLVEVLIAEDFWEFARRYNGPAFEENRYPQKMAAAVERVRGMA